MALAYHEYESLPVVAKQEAKHPLEVPLAAAAERSLRG